MIKRRRTAVLAVFAVVASVFLLPASPASAATFDNACVNSLIPTQSSLIPITMTATDRRRTTRRRPGIRSP